MSSTDTGDLRWWKSSRSGGQGGNCVEVADDGGQWFVRDSKDPDGAILTVSGTAWHAFLRQLTPAKAPGSRLSPVRELPAFVGAGDSGRSDISQRVDEVLAEDGFGQQ